MPDQMFSTVGLSGSSRPAPDQRLFTSKIIEEVIANISSRMVDQALATMFVNCFPNTLDTTTHYHLDPITNVPDTFIITGDIEAMWLRDSTNQVLPYVSYIAQDSHLKSMIEGVINRQVNCVLFDPYANAYNKGNDGGGFMDDTTYKLGFLGTMVPAMNLRLHERKFEIDSLLAVIKLSYAYYNATKELNIFNKDWINAMKSILAVLKDQQKGSNEGSNYFFQRETTAPTDTLLWGVGPPAKRTGMSKSAFRPSDDACSFPFPIAGNAMAVVQLQELSIMMQLLNENELAMKAISLAKEIDSGIQKHGIVKHSIYGDIFAYEVDGYGNHIFMDDANIPSLLALPYLGYLDLNDNLYLNTRNFLLSEHNPYFFNGTAGEGIGGPHVGLNYIWPMSIIMRALTSNNDNEILLCLNTLKTTTASTMFMHESFEKDNASSFTRPWFAWANSLFGELIVTLATNKPHLIF